MAEVNLIVEILTIKDSEGIAKIKYYLVQNDCRILVMELLGPSLEDFLQFCNGKFSLETVLTLAIQMISLVEFIHSRGYVHR